MTRIQRLAPILPLLASVASAQSTIPFCPGVSVVSAVNDIKGDYESIVTIESIDKAAVNLSYSAEVSAAASLNLVSTKRIVRMSDMANARLLHNWFSDRSQRSYPGTTSYQASMAVLRDLKSKGEAVIGLVDRRNSEVTADRSRHPNIFDFEHVLTLHRIGKSSMPVVINNTTINLPAISAAGEYMGDKAEFWFLDDAVHPVSLQFRYTPLGGSTIESRVIKVSHRCTAGSTTASNAVMSALEESLLKSRKADVYQIYFDFNSDRIREESAPTLMEIAEILKRHADWKLTINGHTDNVGGDTYNLGLSIRRAASVKAELVRRYGIGTGRLFTGGAGASRPKATNATLEGRAQNRRVELVRS